MTEHDRCCELEAENAMLARDVAGLKAHDLEMIERVGSECKARRAAEDERDEALACLKALVMGIGELRCDVSACRSCPMLHDADGCDVTDAMEVLRRAGIEVPHD